MKESEVELGTSATQTEFREQSVQFQHIRSAVQGASDATLLDNQQAIPDGTSGRTRIEGNGNGLNLQRAFCGDETITWHLLLYLVVQQPLCLQLTYYLTTLHITLSLLERGE